MANQHKSDPPVFEKCLSPNCTNTIRRCPHDVKGGKNKYCSRKCVATHGAPRKYGQETFDLIMEFYPTHSPAEFAAHLGSTPVAIRKLMSIMRLAGYPLPKEKGGSVAAVIGDNRIRKDRGREYQQVLTASGWRSVPSERKLAARKSQRKQPNGNITSAVRRPGVVLVAPPVKPKVEKTICVMINSRTAIYVADKSEIPGVKEKYAHLNNSPYKA